MKCSFCGKQIPKGRGKIVASRTGDIHYFCSHKCEKNLRMGRKTQKTRWTARYGEEREAKKGKVKKTVKVIEKPKRKRIPKKQRRELRKKKKLEKKKAKKKAPEKKTKKK